MICTSIDTQMKVKKTNISKKKSNIALFLENQKVVELIEKNNDTPEKYHNTTKIIRNNYYHPLILKKKKLKNIKRKEVNNKK